MMPGGYETCIDLSRLRISRGVGATGKAGGSQTLLHENSSGQRVEIRAMLCQNESALAHALNFQWNEQIE